MMAFCDTFIPTRFVIFFRKEGEANIGFELENKAAACRRFNGHGIRTWTTRGYDYEYRQRTHCYYGE